MVKVARIGAMALLVSLAAWADRPASAVGARASTPVLFALVAPLRRHAPPMGGVSIWARPLFDRRLSQAEKAAPLAPELDDAIMRVEPVYDPTRLEGPDAARTLTISAGTAAMDNVFADRWRLADPDANVAQTATALAIVWQAKGTMPCEAFIKRRLVGRDDVAATALTEDECALLLASEARGFAQDAPVPITAAPPADVPVFAAPLPGARMSSEAFWAAQHARVAAIRSRLPGSWPTTVAAATRVAKDRRGARRRVAKLGARQAVEAREIGARENATQDPVAVAPDP